MNQKSYQKQTSSNKSLSHHTNFIEALKSSGTSIVKDTASTISNDLIKGSFNQMTDTLFNSTQNEQVSDNAQEKPPFDFNEYLQSGENAAKQRQHDRVKYEYEQTETVIFNRRQEEIDKRVKEIQVELKKLASEIISLDESTQTVIQQEISDPGIYHLNFFERLLVLIRQLRKTVTESRNWAAMHHRRGRAKSYFWHQANQKVGGTKFLLSQERQVVTQTG